MWRGAVSGLALAVLALVPSRASAQPGVGPYLPRAAWDFYCLTGKAPCLKVRVGLVGGGILSGKSAAPAVGVQGGALLRLGRSFDVGVNVLALGDAREEEGALIVSGEGVLRIILEEYPPNRLWLELAGGVAEVSEPDMPSRPKGSGGVGLTVEIGEKGAGGFLNGGVRLVRSDRTFGVPYLGLGLFF